MNKILAIDPGPVQSAYLLYDPADMRICDKGIEPNLNVIAWMRSHPPFPADTWMVIENVENYGRFVGAGIFGTAKWVGRFIQVWVDLCPVLHRDMKFTEQPRRAVKLWLCNSPHSGNPEVRAALLDKFPATGGGKTPAIGTKGQPGPLYGVKSHLFSALALAVHYAETTAILNLKREATECG